MAKLPIVGMKTLSKELRLEMVLTGKEVMELLAKDIAVEANRLAPTIKEEQVTHPSGLRRGPDKSGRSSSGPIKGSVFAQESQKVANSYLVVSPAWYAHMVEYGTKKHDIKPKRKKSLAFPGRGNKTSRVNKAGKEIIRYKGKIQGLIISPKPVNHPGVRGARRGAHMRPAADKAEQFLRKILSQIK